jgi:hypothetical protein
LTSKDPGHEQTWRIDLLPFNENRPEAFAGLHNKGRRILVIFDEASAIAPVIWETLEAAQTDLDGEIIWLVCGNPLHATGRFRDCFDRYQHRWVTKHVNSLDVSFTNKNELNRWGQDYGIDSDFFRTRVLGQFPRTGSVQFIGPELVDEAMGRELDPSYHDPLVIGVDVARFGEDMSAIYPRRGRDCRTIAPLTFRGLPLDQLEDRIVAFCNSHPVQQIFVDGTGLGGGLVDHLRRRGYMVTDVQFGGKPDQQIDGVKYANQRAHIWGQMRAALKYMCLPANNQALREQLIAPEYSFSRAGDAILLESKDLMRRRGVPSPDLADALACTFAGEIATLPALADWVPGQAVVSEYDPFSEDAILGRPYPEAKAKYVAPGWSRLRPAGEGFEWTREDWEDARASDELRYWREPE